MNKVKSQAKGIIRKVGRGILLSCLIVSISVLGVLASTDAAGQTCTEPPLGLVSWYPGDGNANDIEGGNNGTLQNGATFATGMVGQAFSFDGVNDFVSVPNSTNLNFDATGSFTIDAWVRVDGFTSDNTVVDKRVFQGPEHLGYGIEILDSGSGPQIQFFITDGSTITFVNTGTISLSAKGLKGEARFILSI